MPLAPSAGSRQQRSLAWLPYIAVLLVLAVAALLRFPALPQTGILSVDEGRYVLDGQSKMLDATVAVGIVEGKLAERSGQREFLLDAYLPEARDLLERRTPFLPKVLFSYLIAAVMLVAGYNTWAGNAVEAVFGVAMVAAVYWLGTRWRNRRTGLIAAGILAMSCYHLYYSRNAYPQCTSAFFFLLALGLHHVWQEKSEGRLAGYGWIAAVGAAAGLSFIANFQAGGALPALAVLHFVVSLIAVDHFARLKRFVLGGIAMAGGFFAVLILAEAATYPFILLFRSCGLEYPHQTFVELLLPRVGMHSSVGFNWQGAALFPYFMWVFEGWGSLALGALLIAALAWRGAGSAQAGQPSYRFWVYVACAFLTPWALFSFKTLQGARTFVFIYPILAIVVAAAADKLWTTPLRPQLARVTAVAFLAVWAAFVLVHDWQVMRIRAAWPEAMRWLEQTEEQGAMASWSAVLMAYAEAYGLDGRPFGGYQPGTGAPPYFIADFQELYYNRYPDAPSVVPLHAQPAAVFEHQFGPIFLAAELFPAYGKTFDSIAYVREIDLARARKVCIYDLRETGVRKAGDAGEAGEAPKAGWDTYPGR